jgi:hypothetical protein
LAGGFYRQIMRYLLLTPVLVLAACDDPAWQLQSAPPAETANAALPGEAATVSPTPRPPAEARTVDDFDTTSDEERAAAVAAPTDGGGESLLGTTIASLGSPTEPGIWLETHLTQSEEPGRAEWQGNSVNLELRPSGGEVGSGSEISLAAMRLLEIPLTDLPEISVYRRGNAPGS